MTRAALALSVGGIVVATAVALGSWRVAAMVLDRFGFTGYWPVAMVVVVFSALTALQSAWDRIETLLHRRTRASRGPDGT